MDRKTFLNELHKDKILKETLIETLKEENVPLVMWGCGDVGTTVFHYLKQNNITLSGIWVDAKSEADTFQNIPIDNFSTILSKFETFNVILGHSSYELGENLYKKSEQIQKVFYAPSCIYDQFDMIEYDAIEKEADRFVHLCNALADRNSIENLLAFLNTKMTGDASYILEVFDKGINYFSNNVFSVDDDEVYLDIGAYTGDTIRSFLQHTKGKYQKIIAIEPDGNSFLELSRYVAQERLKNVIVSMSGAWEERVDLEFSLSRQQESGVVTTEQLYEESELITCYAERLDVLFEGEKVSLIKINYLYGALEAIKGCEELIKLNHPKFAIVVGFELYNILLLFEYIESLKLGYKFYLRFNHGLSATLTLYVV